MARRHRQPILSAMLGLLLAMAAAGPALLLATVEPSSAAARSTIVITAAGRLGTEDMELRINGETVATWTGVAHAERRYQHTVTTPTVIESIRVHSTGGGWPESLVIDNIEIDGEIFESELGGTRSQGSWNPSTGCAQGYKRSEWLQCGGGWFEYQDAAGVALAGGGAAPPEQAKGDQDGQNGQNGQNEETAGRITVHARGRLGTEAMGLTINGVEVARWSDLATTFGSYSHEVTEPLTIDSIRVGLIDGGWPKALIVDRIVVDGQTFESEAADTGSVGSWTATTGCSTGYKSSEWLHCHQAWFDYEAARGLTLAASPTSPPDARPRKVLVMTEASVYTHPSIEDGKAMLDRLAAELGVELTYGDDSSLFLDPGRVADVDAVLFLNTDSVVFDTDAEKQAFRAFIEQGRGFIGIHGAAATHWNGDKWNWYRDLVGQRFVDHPTVANQLATVEVVDRSHPSTAHMPVRWEIRDEWYNFEGQPADVNVLLTVDEQSYDGGTMGQIHPIAWNHIHGPGRSRVWYTNLGHEPALYRDEDFVRHVEGGIAWVLDIGSDGIGDPATNPSAP